MKSFSSIENKVLTFKIFRFILEMVLFFILKIFSSIGVNVIFFSIRILSKSGYIVKYFFGRL